MTSDLTRRFAALQPDKLALAVHQASGRIRSLPSEPIAVVGMAGRFPGGANSTAEFWDLLIQGRSGISEVPASRWDIDAYYDPRPGTPGKMYTRHGGFLDDVEQFDAELFHISPREAAGMDPQQRLLLETAWTALDDAAALGDDASLNTGVFVGVMNHDYAQLAAAVSDSDSHTGSGNGMSVAAGRIAHALGLRGPTLSVDTACSSSLVALHLAGSALRAGECDLALACGVNLILAPTSTVVECQMRMLSRDGQCKAFDAEADGFVRGEACGVVVLKRLSDALRDGDRIHALVRGSAVNHDGRSAGLTVPNGKAQERVIRAALADGGVLPSQVGYVEAHGTGTALGDPIEIGALGRVYTEDRIGDLLVGSAKTNVGHTESAAGITGVIKAILALSHGQVPAHLNLSRPNPAIDWDHLPVRIPAEPTPLPASDGRRFAAVSSFGFAGTNAHVVLESAPAITAATTGAASVVDEGPHLLTLSAASPEGLSAAATDMSSWLGRAAAGRVPGSTDDGGLAAVCRATQVRRSHLRHRAVLTVGDTDEAVRRLRAVASGAPAETGTAIGTADGTRPRVAMLFTGNGANYAGMGAGLRSMSSRAAEVLRRCEEVADAMRWPGREHPLRSVIDGADGTEGLLQRIDYAQPALYAVQCALVEAWREWEVMPAAVAGHSMGEYAAAYAAGVFGLEDGMRLALERGRCLARLPVGGMRVCFADQTSVAHAIADLPEVAIAAVNSPRNVVVSGPLPALELAATALAADGIESRPLDVDHAYHSPATDAVLDDFHRVASTFAFSKPTTTFVSALTAGRVDVELTGEDYWTRHIRQPVRFAAAMESLLDLEVDVLLEIGPKASLVGLARAVAAEQNRDDLTFVASLREAGGDRRSLLDAAGLLQTRGARLDWEAIGPGGSPFADLPLPPFDRRAYWLGEAGEGAQPGTVGSATTVRGTHGAVHPLLGSRLRFAGGERRYEVDLAPHRPGYLRDHVVAGQTVLPGAALVELLRAAMVEAGRDGVLRDLELRRAVVLAESGPTTVQTAVGDDGAEVFVLAGDDDWVSVASAVFGVFVPAPPAAWADGGDLSDVDVAGYYEHYAAGGLDYGADFRSIQSLASAPGRSLARLALPQGVDASGTELHPVLLDGALQAIGAALPPGDTRLWVPAAIGEVRVERPLGSLTTARVTVEGDPADGLLLADIVLVDDGGRPAAHLSRVRLQPVAAGRLGLAGPDPRTWLYDTELRPAVRRFPPVPLRLPTPDQLREGAQPFLEALLRDTSLQSHGQALDELDELVPFLIQGAVTALGGSPDGQEAELSVARLGIAERHHRLWPHLLRLRSSWVAPLDADVEARLERLAERAPAEVGMVRRTGERLADVLAGRVDPLTLLFPDGDTDGAAALYERSAGYRAMNGLVASTLTQLLGDLDPRDGVRVLEVGAGTGATTAQALLAIPPDVSEYVFTDISPHFLSRARARFAHHQQLRTAVLDISQDPQLQGEHAGRYDVVIAANVLHATPDLAASLQHVRRLLAPGGRLILVEALATRPWLDITFGLTDGWWAFADSGLDPARAESPLLDLDGWQTALREAGFDEVALLSSLEDDRPAQAGVIVAGATQETVTARRLLLIGDDPAVDLAAVDSGHEVHRVADVPAAVARLADSRFDVVIDAWPQGTLADAIDPARLAAAVEGVTQRAVSLLPALTALPETDRPRWVITTRGAHGHPGGCDPTAALPLGLARALHDEVATVDCHVVDACDEVDGMTLLREVLAQHERGPIVLRDGLRLTPVLRRWPLPRTTVPGRTPSLRRDGSYLITGGLTGLGLVTAGWAVARGATRLVLVGRRDPGPDARAEISKLELAGVRVDVLSADVSNADDLDRVRRQVADHPLRGIVHAAGGLSDGMLGSIDAERFAAPLNAKVIGSGLLAGLARDAEVDFLVCYSSAVSLLGSVGQANHVIGATFQDLLAHGLDGRGIATTSVNWGAWSQVGAAADEGTLARMAARGLGALTPEDGLAALDLVLQDPPANVAVVPIDWSTVLAGVNGVEAHPSLAPIIGAEQQVAAPHTSGREDALLAALGDMAAEEVASALNDYVLVTVGGVIGRALSPGDADRPLHDLGLDSLIAIDVRNRLLAGVDVDVPVEDLVGGGTPADVARTLTVRLLASAATDHADDAAEYEEEIL